MGTLSIPSFLCAPLWGHGCFPCWVDSIWAPFTCIATGGSVGFGRCLCSVPWLTLHNQEVSEPAATHPPTGSCSKFRAVVGRQLTAGRKFPCREGSPCPPSRRQDSLGLQETLSQGLASPCGVRPENV
ncbi:unnamed protein product [Natator depressus]